MGGVASATSYISGGRAKILMEDHDNARATGGLKKGVKKDQQSFRWDEDTIARHDLERGTRMKVDEPKTPYLGPQADPSMGDPNLVPSFSLEGVQDTYHDPNYRVALSAALLNAANNSKTNAAQEPELTEAEQESKKQEFDRKRKEHYRMFG